ncbi:MAG: outer membrane protein assembly factor BamD [Holosporales bacterium]|nr:outer membrane protein assembly factor BamD [Holosporales bacterium]
MENKVSFSNVLYFFLAFLLTSCNKSTEPQIGRPMGKIYQNAFEKLKEADYDKASEEFDEVERQYPYSSWAPKAQLMSAYSSYRKQNFERAIGTLDNFITLHPHHPEIAYAYYLRALCYYDDIAGVTKDPRVAELALEALTQILNRFASTPYGRDARFKRDYVFGHLAGQQMSIGRFYLNQKDYLSAFTRFQNVINLYPTSPQTPEALHRLVESALALGLSKEAQKAASVLGFNFPKSSWYKDTYALIKGGNEALGS